MGRLACRHLVVWFRFHGVNEVGELDGILDEKDRHVVANQVPVTLVRVELRGKAADVADGILGATI